ncbi:hypothetical protein [Paenibacillus wenxiniae]|uniref:Uncharacterized protein n=1 Tax=Paenibacillus wenxiniae TaxID=1636843 RepID=A0ABW4RMY9_9BACL
MNDKWIPSTNLDLIDVINTHSIKGVQVGSPESVVLEIMGAAQLPATKLSKKSKVLHHLYGNVNVLSENGYVIAINIDFHSNRTEMVAIGEIDSWGIDDWMQLAKKEGWIVTKTEDVIQCVGNGIMISLSRAGEVGLLSLRSC